MALWLGPLLSLIFDTFSSLNVFWGLINEFSQFSNPSIQICLDVGRLIENGLHLVGILSRRRHSSQMKTNRNRGDAHIEHVYSQLNINFLLVSKINDVLKQ